MKKQLAVLSAISLLILPGMPTSGSAYASLQASNRKYSQMTHLLINESSSYQSMAEKETDFGFTILGTDLLSAASISSTGLWESSLAEVEVTTRIRYYESQGRMTLELYPTENEKQSLLPVEIEGLVTRNSYGDPDILLADEDGTVYLAEWLDRTMMKGSFWGQLASWISDVANSVKDVVVKGLRLMTKVAVRIIGLDNGARILNMAKDSNGIYHADFDCWQRFFGYMDLYDIVFNLGTEMQPTKNEFYDENNDGVTDYILWGWKGDYWELGYGGELGIYKRLGRSEIYYVDKDLAIDMTLKVEYRETLSSPYTTIINWDPTTNKEGFAKKNWWITGFNPAYNGRPLSDKNLLRVSYSARFWTKGYPSLNYKLKEAFYDKFVYVGSDWGYNVRTDCFHYSF